MRPPYPRRRYCLTWVVVISMVLMMLLYNGANKHVAVKREDTDMYSSGHKREASQHGNTLETRRPDPTITREDPDTAGSIRKAISRLDTEVVMPARNATGTVNSADVLMDDCPAGWPLEVIEMSDIAGTPAQVCRKIDGIGEWKCAPGWEQLERRPFCLRKRRSPECSALSDDRKLLFVNIPHTGGMTIAKSDTFDSGHHGDATRCQGKRYHSIEAFDAAAYEKYHKFAMVRHPCSRLISAWRYYLNDASDNSHFDKDLLSSFTSFVERIVYPGGDALIDSEEHLRPQVSMLFNEGGQFGLDRLLYFERWNEGMGKLERHLKINTSSLTYPSSYEENCTAMYTERTWSTLKSLYAIDFCVLQYSQNMANYNKPKTQQRIPEGLTARYQQCTKSTTMFASSSGDSYYKDQHTNQSCIMNTYFVLTPGSSEKDKVEKAQTLDFWKRSWASAGWIPRILSEEDAKSHPAYEKHREVFWSFPRVHGREYGYNNLMRHLAMANVGGGWMSDSDVFPLRLPGCTAPLNGGSFTVYQGFVPALVSGNASEYFRVSTLMANVDWKSNSERFTVDGKDHVSDMYCLRKFRDDGSIETVTSSENAKYIFKTPFYCNNTNINGEQGSLLEGKGWPSLPTVAHFSHSAISYMRKTDPAVIQRMWESYEGTESYAEYIKSRVVAMKVAEDFFHKTCL